MHSQSVRRHEMRAQNRINNPDKIDRLLIESELREGKLVIIQFSDKIYTDRMLAELNELCQTYDENFSIRFYGHHQGSFDCKTLLKLPNIKALWLDCLVRIDNSECLTELQNLKRLSLGVFELKDTEILQAKNFQHLKELIIGDTKTKALNLQYLAELKELNYLIICGHTKNIDVVGQLTNIKYLGLNSIPKVPLTFVNNLKKLKSLHLVLGGRENIDEIGVNEIETLEIIRVRSFSSFNNISNFKKLKNLTIEDQIQLKKIHFKEELPSLEDFKLINCKTFKYVTGIEHLKTLHQLRIYKTDINFDEFVKQSFPTSLEILAFYTAKIKIDRQIKERLSKLGFKDGLEDKTTNA